MTDAAGTKADWGMTVTTSTYEANTSNLAIPALWAGIPSQPNLRATPTQAGLLAPRTIEAGAGLLQLFESSVTLRVVKQVPTPAAPFTVVGTTEAVTVVFSAAVAGTYTVTGPTVTFTPSGGWPMTLAAVVRT